jgi:hypothetical protein
VTSLGEGVFYTNLFWLTIPMRFHFIQEVQIVNDNESKVNTQEQDSPGHRFDQLMFGNRKPRSHEANTPTNKGPNQSPSQEFDLMGMLQNVDQLMGSFNQFKPMVKQLSPLLDLFKSKK